jgi:Mg2+/citrate symporter
MIEVTPADIVRKLLPVIVAGLVACVGVGVWVGRAIDQATRSIGQTR